MACVLVAMVTSILLSDLLLPLRHLPSNISIDLELNIMYDIDNGLPQRFQKVVKCHTVILSKIPETKAFQMAMHDYLNEPLQKPVFSNHNLQCTENIICSLPPYFIIFTITY